jgi:hypothetical protein
MAKRASKSSKKHSPGRPNLYVSHVKPRLLEIEKWYSNGVTDAQVAENLNVGLSNYYRYKGRFRHLREAIKRGSEVACDNMEGAVYKSGMGYNYEEVHTESFVEEKDGKKVHQKVVKIAKHVPGNVGAQAFFLKNKRPELWKDRHELDFNKLPPVRLFDVDEIP